MQELRKGFHFVLSGSLSLGTLFIFSTYIGSFFEPIQESSTHQEPLAKDGLYKRLYELQPAEA